MSGFRLPGSSQTQYGNPATAIASYVQTPRFTALLNGTAAQYPVSFEVQQNNFSIPARFTCELAVDQPTAADLAGQTQISVQIQATTTGLGSPTTLIYGLVDHVTFNPLHLTMVLAGRDLLGLLVDSPTQNTYQNLTSSQIVEQFVSEHAGEGLQGNITATSKPVGRFYGIDYGFTIFQQFYRATNEWDLILFLAQMEGFEARLQGQTLYFGPPIQNAPIYEIAVDYGPPIASNAEQLTATRSLTLAKDVQVQVLSWNSMLMRPIKETATKESSAQSASGGGPQQNYVFYKPDLTPDQALQYANMKLREITKRERIVEFTIPMELAMTPSSMVRLTGTKTSWDQDYFIDQIVRSGSFEHGFTERVRLKNVSPASQALVE